MSKEIVIRDIYAALMSDDDWDDTTAESIDSVLEMYGYGPDNPGHGIIGQISDVLYTQEDWDQGTVNAIALVLAEDSRRRRIETIGHMDPEEASDFLANVLRANPPSEYGGITIEKYEHNPHYAARRGERSNVEGFESVKKGDLITVKMPAGGEFVGVALGLTPKGWHLEGRGGIPVYATPDNILSVGYPGEVRKGIIYKRPSVRRSKSKKEALRPMPKGVGKVHRRRR